MCILYQASVVDFLQKGYSTYSTIIYAGVSKPWHPIYRYPTKAHSAAPVKSMSLSRAQMYLDHEIHGEFNELRRKYGENQHWRFRAGKIIPNGGFSSHVWFPEGGFFFLTGSMHVHRSRNIIWRWLKKSSDAADKFSLLIIQFWGYIPIYRWIQMPLNHIPFMQFY